MKSGHSKQMIYSIIAMVAAVALMLVMVWVIVIVADAFINWGRK
jgi:hypothetical protein